MHLNFGAWICKVILILHSTANGTKQAQLHSTYLISFRLYSSIKGIFFKQKHFKQKIYSVKKINIFFLIQSGAKFPILKPFPKLN